MQKKNVKTLDDSKHSRSPPRVGPLRSVGDVRSEMARVYRAARMGRLDLGDAKSLTYILVSLGALIRDSDLEQRIAQLEAAVDAQQED